MRVSTLAAILIGRVEIEPRPKECPTCAQASPGSTQASALVVQDVADLWHWRCQRCGSTGLVRKIRVKVPKAGELGEYDP